MNNIICRNCGFAFLGNKCPKCGYNMNISNPDKNVIQNKALKENIADAALSILANDRLISLEKDLKHLVVEFGYLFLPENSNNVSDVKTLLKVMPPKKMFQSQKTYYLGTQDGKLLLLNESFNEAMFRKISNDVLLMHKVDLNTIDKKDYTMELY